MRSWRHYRRSNSRRLPIWKLCYDIWKLCAKCHAFITKCTRILLRSCTTGTVCIIEQIEIVAVLLINPRVQRNTLFMTIYRMIIHVCVILKRQNEMLYFRLFNCILSLLISLTEATPAIEHVDNSGTTSTSTAHAPSIHPKTDHKKSGTRKISKVKASKMAANKSAEQTQNSKKRKVSNQSEDYSAISVAPSLIGTTRPFPSSILSYGDGRVVFRLLRIVTIDGNDRVVPIW
jgi:hypothetical protein